MENNRNQDGTGTSDDKRINEYKGGKPRKPKPVRMSPTSAMIAATATAKEIGDKVKELNKIFEQQREIVEITIDNFKEAAIKIPKSIEARLYKEDRDKIDNLQRSIDNANFDKAVKSSFDKASMGWLGAHKAAAWAVLITSVLLCVAFAMLAIQTSVSKGRAEEQAEQYKADAMNWRQFKEKNPRTAARFLKQKEQQLF